MAVALVLFAIKFWSVHLRCLVVPASLDSHTSYEANEEASKEICFKQIMHPIAIRYSAGQISKEDLKPIKKTMLLGLGLKAIKRPAAAAKAASKRPAAADAVPKKEQKKEKGEEEEEQEKKDEEEEEEEEKGQEEEEEEEELEG